MTPIESIILGIMCGAVLYFGMSISDKLSDVKNLLMELIKILDKEGE